MEILYYILISFLWWSFIAAFAISAGYHRYFSHKSFQPRNEAWYEWSVLALGSLAGGAPLLTWVGSHRMHHAHSDTLLDPHSPTYVGFFRVLTSTWKVDNIPRKYVRNLLKNHRVLFFYKNFTQIRVATIVIGFLIMPLEYFLSLIIAPMIYAYIGYGLINTMCHLRNEPRNSVLANIFSAGEGYHANHHIRPYDWRLGKKWYHFDTGAWIIQMIKK